MASGGGSPGAAAGVGSLGPLADDGGAGAVADGGFAGGAASGAAVASGGGVGAVADGGFMGGAAPAGDADAAADGGSRGRAGSDGERLRAGSDSGRGQAGSGGAQDSRTVGGGSPGPAAPDGSARGARAAAGGSPGPGRSVHDAPAPAELAADADGSARWRLTGAKCWISNAPEADFYTVFARTTPGAGARGVTAFLVPADRPGLTGAGLDMLSPHPIGALDFDAVPVTADDVLGEVDRGFRVAMGTLNLFRPSVGAFAVGMARAALDATVAHTAGRDAFGGKLRDLQAVSHQVAEMALRTEAARLMVYAAATAYDEGAPDVPRLAAMAKLLATETAQYVVDTAVQLHGARALQRGHLLEHLYREVRAPRIYEGASEVQRGIIAKELYAAHQEA
ncbi:acyl-CoA dehydrogenase family protein [Streptomyces sp. NPDC050416]|uniref:acyl-CoA dehydrogenase family protein n=1 Tax=Streptomyces sp. NPDC050416 TaxID=3365611 RepID=UPI0037A097F0